MGGQLAALIGAAAGVIGHAGKLRHPALIQAVQGKAAPLLGIAVIGNAEEFTGFILRHMAGMGPDRAYPGHQGEVPLVQYG